eukprot:8899698-Pyramimonas_sp.AAC.2
MRPPREGERHYGSAVASGGGSLRHMAFIEGQVDLLLEKEARSSRLIRPTLLANAADISDGVRLPYSP